MKKIISLITAIALMMSLLAGCGESNNKSQTNSSKNKEIKIGVLLNKSSDPIDAAVFSSIQKNANQKAHDTGQKITVTKADSEGQQSVQNDEMDTFISQKYDVICVNLVDISSASVLMDKAKKAGVPLLFFEGQPSKTDITKADKNYYIGSDTEEEGAAEGKIMADYFKTHPQTDKNKDGKLEYVLLEGTPKQQETINLSEKSISATEAAGIKTVKLAEDTANGQRAQGQEKMAEWLAAYGNQIEAVYSNNDEMALGAIEALKAAGYFNSNKFIPVVGAGAAEAAIDSIGAGQLLGTVLKDSDGEGKGVFDIAYSLAKGGNPEKDVKGIQESRYLWIPYQPITKANLNDFKK